MIIDGFELSGPSDQFSLAPRDDNITIRNNIIESGVCVWVKIDGLNYTHNLVRNTDPAEVYGSVYHNAIYAEDGGDNWTVTDNKITEVRNAIVMSNVNREYSNIVFSRNEVIEPLVMGVNIGGNTIIGDITIHDNIMTNIGNSGVYFGFSDVRISDDAEISIFNNEMSNAVHGVFLAADEAGSGAKITVTNNTISDGGVGVRVYTASVADIIEGINYNKFIDNTWGVYNDSTTEVNATNNWWGDESGPTHAGNPDGTGNAANDNVDYDPWFNDEDMTIKTKTFNVTLAAGETRDRQDTFDSSRWLAEVGDRFIITLKTPCDEAVKEVLVGEPQ